MKRLVTLLVFGMILTSVIACSRVKLDTDGGISRQQLMLLHNIERGQQKVDQLEYDSELESRAQKHAEWMASNNNLKHSRLGSTNYITEGENIAMGQTTEDEVVQDWMTSAGHRKNILNPRFTHAGFGYAKRSDGVAYWCAQFGGR